MPDLWLVGSYVHRRPLLDPSDRTAKPRPCMPISADRRPTSAFLHLPALGAGDDRHQRSGDQVIGVGHIH
jgi:hypothetical protein